MIPTYEFLLEADRGDSRESKPINISSDVSEVLALIAKEVK